ncbi:porin [Epibacterium ulvae]|uniref:porin n=1 Tax=Epibacterium ulvae TaxID=1156985 RepID=UPI001BFCA6BC|nr:porin [Epibacterium ulvae]MBT8153493.1 porin [Epibacterium ulvae]
MKKILFATSALIATAGMAAAEAELTFGGYGRFGLVYNEGAEGDDKRTALEQRFRLNIGANVTLDSGVKLEGRFQVEANDESEGGAAGNGPGAAEFSVSTGSFRLDLGNTGDLLDTAAIVDTYGVGTGQVVQIEAQNTFADLIDTNGYGEGDITRNTVRASYSVGDFDVSASYTEDNTAVDLPSYYQVGARYDFGPVAFGAVYGERDDDFDTDYWVANLSGTFGDLSASLLFADGEFFDEAGYSLNVVYDVSSSTRITAILAGGGDSINAETAAVTEKETVYALGFQHSLGNGVSLRGGAGENASGNVVGDLGVRFDF